MSEEPLRILIVGGGRMGRALVGGLVSAGWAPEDLIAVADPATDALDAAEALFPRARLLRSVAGVVAEGAVLAVKPDAAAAACAELSKTAVPRILSIVAGVPTEAIESWLARGVAVVRAMPNTPALVGTSASAIAPGSLAGEDDLGWAESVLASVGTVSRVPEVMMDAVTGVSGSGPAWVFYLAEALIEAGVRLGLTEADSHDLVVQTVLGAGRMLAESGGTPAELREAVTSPGGTTAAGLGVLGARDVRGALVEAVTAAAARSAELGAAHRRS